MFVLSKFHSDWSRENRTSSGTSSSEETIKAIYVRVDGCNSDRKE